MNWQHVGHCPITGCRIYRAGSLTVLLCIPGTKEYTETGRYHLSISHPMRYPKWDEIASARYYLLPDSLTMMMYLPPREEYVNVHRNCFHLHESREKF
jgi:hypothetical protein